MNFNFNAEKLYNLVLNIIFTGQKENLIQNNILDFSWRKWELKFGFLIKKIIAVS